MKSEQIIRSWKEEDYRLSLSEAEQALLPEDPAGLVELTDADLNEAGGGTDWTFITICTPSHVTFCVPTGDLLPCSWFGCPTWTPLLCYFW
jgi:mersacidin/lichenicidin family type 2 lantibiotic